MNEASVLKHIMLAASRGLTRLFRNNVGKAWLGKSEQFQRATQVMVYPGDVVVRQAQLVTYGLCVGSSDAIGWTQHVITPADVGAKVAIFTAIEAKAERGRATDEQKNFIERVIDAGGIAGIARSDEEALTILSTPITVAVPTKELPS